MQQVTKSISINPKLNDDIIKEAKRQKRSFSNMIEFGMSEYLKMKL